MSLIEIPNGIPDDDSEGFAVRITGLGWLGMLSQQDAAGHHVPSCDCLVCPKARYFVAKLQTANCAFCGRPPDGLLLKGSDTVHCRRCHNKRCSPRANPCMQIPDDIFEGMEAPVAPPLREEDWLPMTTWPATPTEERLRAALDVAGNRAASPTLQARDDADLLNRADYLLRWGIPIAEKLLPEMDEGESQVMLGLGASGGETQDTIGLTIMPEPHRLLISRLMRHPEWTGLNPQLSDLRGIEVIVTESCITKDLPGTITAHHEPMEYWRTEREPSPFPEGAATAIQEMVLWHGAASCLWYPGPQGAREARKG